MPRILVQAGHLDPRQPGHEKETGATGEMQLVRRIRDAIVDLLRRDSRFEALSMPGLIPWGAKCDAAVFLHADAAGPSARGCSFGFDERYPVNKRLADLIWEQFQKIPGHPDRRRDNGTEDAHRYYGFGLVDTAGPEALVEHGFVTNPDERKWLESHVAALATAHYSALLKYFGLPAAHSEPPLPAGTTAETTKPVSLRRTATAQGTPVAELPKGAAVSVVAVPSDRGWRRVRVNGYVELSALTRSSGGDTAITTDAAILAKARASRSQVEEHLLARPHESAPDPEVREIARLYFDTCAQVGVDALLAVAQMVLETGNLTSWWSQPPRRNLAGIGVTGAPGAGCKFDSWSAAVRAHVGRLLRYALREGTENAAQEQLIAEALQARPLPQSYWGAAPTLAGLALTWAEDASYAAKIARIANDIRARTRIDLIPGDDFPLIDDGAGRPEPALADLHSA